MRGADVSLNHGAGRRMVRFDHIAVMGIFRLNAADTLRLQNPLLINGKQWPDISYSRRLVLIARMLRSVAARRERKSFRCRARAAMRLEA